MIRCVWLEAHRHLAGVVDMGQFANSDIHKLGWLKLNLSLNWNLVLVSIKNLSNTSKILGLVSVAWSPT